MTCNQREIWKYRLEVEDSQTILMPMAELLTVQLQGGVPTLWAIVDLSRDSMDYKIRCYGTGNGHPAHDERYLGTVQLNEFVWHYFAHADV